MELVGDKLAIGQVFVRVFPTSSVDIFPPKKHTHFKVIWNQHCKILIIHSKLKKLTLSSLSQARRKNEIINIIPTEEDILKFLLKKYHLVSPCARFSVAKQIVISVTKKFPELYEKCLLSGHYNLLLKPILKSTLYFSSHFASEKSILSLSFPLQVRRSWFFYSSFHNKTRHN